MESRKDISVNSSNLQEYRSIEGNDCGKCIAERVINFKHHELRTMPRRSSTIKQIQFQALPEQTKLKKTIS